MLTRHRVRRSRLLAATLGLVISATIAGAGIASAANPNRTFDVTACATPNGKNVVLTATWSGVQVDAWSWFVESIEGSGGVFQPVPQPGTSGTLTQTFPAEDVSSIQAVNATIFRATGPNFRELDSVTVSQPATGWSRC